MALCSESPSNSCQRTARLEHWARMSGEDGLEEESNEFDDFENERNDTYETLGMAVRHSMMNSSWGTESSAIDAESVAGTDDVDGDFNGGCRADLHHAVLEKIEEKTFSRVVASRSDDNDRSNQPIVNVKNSESVSKIGINLGCMFWRRNLGNDMNGDEGGKLNRNVLNMIDQMEAESLGISIGLKSQLDSARCA